MSRTHWKLSVLSLAVSVVGLSGCGPTPPQEDTSSQSQKPDEHGHSHAHPEEGLHHGVLVELGNEDYHAEVVHDDDAGSVTVYLLDSAAKEAVTSEAAEVVINIKNGDTPSQFKLPALTVEGEPAEKHSAYALTSKELLDGLHAKGATAKLSVTIDDRPFTGSIQADDHAGHNHPH